MTTSTDRQGPQPVAAAVPGTESHPAQAVPDDVPWLSADQLRAWIGLISVAELLPARLDSQLQRDAEQHGGQPFEHEQPLPARESARAVQREQRAGHDVDLPVGVARPPAEGLGVE